MYGYVRPFRPELKCRDYDLYRMAYCGLCRRLKRDYGRLSTLFLSYDITFLTLLLWGEETEMTPCRGRCTVNPLRTEEMCPDSPALETAAAEGMILAWWSLRDKIRDERGLKRLGARILALLLKRSYRRAALRCPDFDRSVRTCLEELAGLEEENCPSLDRTADTFARLLRSCVPEEDRVRSQLLYHLGRWIYLADARDDLDEDRAAGRYNPVLARYGPEGDDTALAQTMSLSLYQMDAAFQLGSFGPCRAVLENILGLGLPLVQKCILNGTWSQIKKQDRVWSSKT